MSNQAEVPLVIPYVSKIIVHKCEFCSKVYMDKTELDNHLRTSHTFMCSICQFKFPGSDKELFKNHYKLMHSKKQVNSVNIKLIGSNIVESSNSQNKSPIASIPTVPSITANSATLKQMKTIPSILSRQRILSRPNISSQQTNMPSVIPFSVGQDEFVAVNLESLPSHYMNSSSNKRRLLLPKPLISTQPGLIIDNITSNNIKIEDIEDMVIEPLEFCDITNIKVENNDTEEHLIFPCDLCNQNFNSESEFENHSCPKQKTNKSDNNSENHTTDFEIQNCEIKQEPIELDNFTTPFEFQEYPVIKQEPIDSDDTEFDIETCSQQKESENIDTSDVYSIHNYARLNSEYESENSDSSSSDSNEHKINVLKSSEIKSSTQVNKIPVMSPKTSLIKNDKTSLLKPVTSSNNCKDTFEYVNIAGLSVKFPPKNIYPDFNISEDEMELEINVLKVIIESRLNKELELRGDKVDIYPVTVRDWRLFNIIRLLKLKHGYCGYCESIFVGWPKLKLHHCGKPINVPYIKKTKILQRNKVNTINKIPDLSKADWSSIPVAQTEYKCTECRKIYIMQGYLKLHLKNVHNKIVCKKTTCIEYFDNEEAFDEHNKSIHNDYAILCELCGCEVLTRNLRKHMVRHHNIITQGFTCDICQKTFDSKYRIYNHMLVHLEYRRYKCHICKQKYYKYHHLKYHLLIHSKPSFECKCGKKFKTPLSLNIHINGVHKNSWVYHCKLCDYSNNTLKQVLNHYKSQHMNVKNKKIKDKDKYYQTSSFQCEFCCKYFKNRTKFVTHLKQKHRINQMEYENMDKITKEKLLLEGKLDIDSLELKCPHCDKVCITKRGFNVHLQIHNKKFKFKCHVCNRKFASQLQMTSHQLSHVQDFNCNFCNLHSNSKFKIKKHIIKCHINV